MTIVKYCSYLCSAGLINSASTDSANSSSYLFGLEICNVTYVHQCFKYDNSTKQCTLKDCHIIFKGTRNKVMCTDGKKSHTTAVAFSGALHLLGFGSFYVDRHIIGIFQLLYTLISIIIAVATLYKKDHKWLWHKIKSCVCKISTVVPAGESSSNEGCCCIPGLGITITALLTLGRIIWWIVEVVKFGENTIKDGDGCALYTNMHEL